MKFFTYNEVPPYTRNNSKKSSCVFKRMENYVSIIALFKVVFFNVVPSREETFFWPSKVYIFSHNFHILHITNHAGPFNTPYLTEIRTHRSKVYFQLELGSRRSTTKPPRLDLFKVVCKLQIWKNKMSNS